MQHYVIDQVSWHLGRRNYEFDESIIFKYFKSILDYLQKNNLTVRTILAEGEEVVGDTHLKTADLTEEGMLLIKAAYDKWVTKVTDGKTTVDDYRILDKALKKIRG